MGMTIDEAIKNGIDLIDAFKKYFPSDKAIDTVGELVEIAKKYQKIEQIANDKNINGDLLRMSEIRWVLKDGNDN